MGGKGTLWKSSPFKEGGIDGKGRLKDAVRYRIRGMFAGWSVSLGQVVCHWDVGGWKKEVTEVFMIYWELNSGCRDHMQMHHSVVHH